MFRRRTPRPWLRKLSDTAWPRLGWSRYLAYLRLRLSRLAGTPHSIALGVACGVLIAPTPILGAHIIAAALLAVLLRANVIASALGGLIGNPWTYPLLWVVTLEIGRSMVPQALWDSGGGDVNFVTLFTDLTTALLTGDLAMLAERVLPIWILMMIGSVPLGAVMAVASYWLTRRAIERLQRARAHRRERRRRGRSSPALVSASELPGAE